MHDNKSLLDAFLSCYQLVIYPFGINSSFILIDVETEYLMKKFLIVVLTEWEYYGLQTIIITKIPLPTFPAMLKIHPKAPNSLRFWRPQWINKSTAKSIQRKMILQVVLSRIQNTELNSVQLIYRFNYNLAEIIPYDEISEADWFFW